MKLASIANRFINKLQTIPIWQFLAITIILTEISTAILNAIQSFIWWGRFSTDLMLIGMIDAFIVSPDSRAYCHVSCSVKQRIRQKTAGKTLYLQNITASLGEGVYVLDKRGHLTFRNPEAERLTGWAEAELLGKNIHKAIHHHRINGTEFPVEECPAFKVTITGAAYHTDEDYFFNKDGHMFPVAYISSPVIEDGKVVASVTVFHNIAKRKELENELQNHICDIERFNRMSVSRELKMVELKKEVNELLKMLGKDEKYNIAVEENE